MKPKQKTWNGTCRLEPVALLCSFDRGTVGGFFVTLAAVGILKRDGSWICLLVFGSSLTVILSGPRPLVQCRFRPVQFCASMSVAVAASRAVQLQTWCRKLTPHPSYYSLLLPLYVLHRPLSTQE
jgi:hypothetical protein